MLRSDNAPERLTPLGREWGLVDDERWGVQEDRRAAMVALTGYLKSHHVEVDGKRQRLWDWIRRPNIDADDVLARLNGDPVPRDPVRIAALLSKVQYAGFIERHRKQWQRVAKQEHRRIPEDLDYHAVTGLRNECKHVLEKFQPSTLGQASRLAGITPADLTVLTLALQRE